MSQTSTGHTGPAGRTYRSQVVDDFVNEMDDLTFPVEGGVAPHSGSNYETSPTGRKFRKRMFCFECNREENHNVTGYGRVSFSFLVGFTFGLVYLIGPYRCQCCGSRRLGRFDILNTRYWYRSIQQSSTPSSGAKRRSSRKSRS